MSLHLFRQLGLKFENQTEYVVRLADGQTVKTCGQCVVDVALGSTTYVATFHVVPGAVPPIFGMSFLGEKQPVIDWQQRTMFIDGQQILTVPFGKARVAQHVQETTTPVVNSFGLLNVPECVIDDESEVVATQGFCVKQQVDTSLGGQQKRACVQCGAHVLADATAPLVKCAKCANASFEHLVDQVTGEYVAANIEQKSCATPVATLQEPELVSLQQFTRAGKRGMYEFCGIMQLQMPDVAQSKNVQNCNFAQTDAQQSPVERSARAGKFQQKCADVASDVAHASLHFTHRTSHGATVDDASADTGKFQKLADEQLAVLKRKYPEVFAEPQYPVDRTSCPVQIEHEIRLKDEHAPPPKRKIYPLDNVELEELKTQLQVFLESNRIVPSNSPYGAPILFAKKKGGALRMCIDYRLLNSQSIIDSFPLPRIDELLQRLNGACVFSKIDLRDGYHQIPMSEKDHAKTAFSCRYGTYEFLVMPFGLSSAPGTFQRLMNQVFFDLLDKGVVCYLDNLLLYSRSIEEHKMLLDSVFSLLHKNKLFVKDSKCHFFLQKVNFLGHVVSSDGVAMETGKLQVVQDWPKPSNLVQVQQFLGLANYYRRFVLRFSELAGPLTMLTRKGQPFVWNQKQQQAFDLLKKCLCSSPVLKLFDKNLYTRVVCDASNFCIGAVLEQQDAITNKWHPVEYYSKRLSDSERNYSATDREFVAIRLALARWRQFLIGRKFLILTDHAALTHLQTSAGVNRRNARWLDFLSQFQFDIQHIKGRENVVADILSRIPGSEILTHFELCSSLCTLGVEHVQDLPVKLCDTCTNADVSMHQQSFDFDIFGENLQFLNGIISIQERDTFRQQLVNEQQACSSVWFQNLLQQAQHGSTLFQLRNGLLCKLVNDHFCPVVPDFNSSTVSVILSDLHSSALGGHLGRRKLLAAVQKRFYWQNMYRSVEKFIRECTVCQQNKSTTQKPRGLLQPLENPVKCFDHVSMDFIMNLPRSTRGYDAIFSIVDRFSRLVRFIPCQSDLTASDAAQLFFEHWVCRFGMPSKIISDRDPRFQSSFWQSLMNSLQCRVALSTSYHPQTDGLTERYHRSVEQILQCYCSSQQDSWCVLLSQCEFALNSNVQDSHQQVPFEVVYGYIPVIPLDHSLSLQSQYAQDTVSARLKVHSQVALAQEAASQRMAASADAHRRESGLAVGMQVWLSTAHLPIRVGARKLSSKWTGPFTIESQVTREAWKLSLPSTWRVHPVFHSSQLKPVVGSPRAQPPVLLDEQQEEFEVDRILAERTVKGAQQYLVHWKGYSHFEDTWEPVSNLTNAKEKLAEFLGNNNVSARGHSARQGRKLRSS